VKRRFVATAGIALLISTAANFAVREPSLDGMKSLARATTSCGVERWKVKTLQDKPSLHAIQAATIAQLIAVPKPDPLPGTRAPFEFKPVPGDGENDEDHRRG
jgi:hypothetical protein